jgi:hypothetical protein
MTFEKIPRQFSSVGLGLPLVGSVSEKSEPRDRVASFFSVCEKVSSPETES